jgi:hypothetical protein
MRPVRELTEKQERDKFIWKPEEVIIVDKGEQDEEEEEEQPSNE